MNFYYTIFFLLTATFVSHTMDIESQSIATYGILIPQVLSKNNFMSFFAPLVNTQKESLSLPTEIKNSIIDIHFDHIKYHMRNETPYDAFTQYLQESLLPLRAVNKESYKYIGNLLAQTFGDDFYSSGFSWINYPNLIWLRYCHNNLSDIKLLLTSANLICHGITSGKPKLLKMACKLDIDLQSILYEGGMTLSLLDNLLYQRIWHKDTIKLVAKYGHQWNWNANHLKILYQQLNKVDQYEGGSYIHRDYREKQKQHRQKILDSCLKFIPLAEKTKYFLYKKILKIFR